MAYHVADGYFDWLGYYELQNNEAFYAIPKGSTVAEWFFLASCISGTLFSLVMLVVYGYYIIYHLSCMCTLDDCSKECNRRFLTKELVVSVCELLFKDDIQSILLFMIYNSGPEKECISHLTKVFVICSMIAHLKLLACFATKLCGFGAGEKCDSGLKCLFCFLGCIGSVIFLIFTSLYFAEIQNVSTCGTLNP